MSGQHLDPDDPAGWDDAEDPDTDHAAPHDGEDPFRADAPDDGRTELFPGDTGTWPRSAREAMVALLNRTHLWEEADPRMWRALLDHESDIRAACHNLFIDLRIDRERRIAYKAAADADNDLRLPDLLRDAAWRKEETIVLLHLRRLLHADTSEDGRVFVDAEELYTDVTGYLTDDIPDRAAVQRAYRNAITAMSKRGILRKVRNSDDRYRVSRMVEIILDKDGIDRIADILADDLSARTAAKEKP